MTTLTANRFCHRSLRNGCLRESVMNLAADVPPELLPAPEQMAVSLGWHITLAYLLRLTQTEKLSRT